MDKELKTENDKELYEKIIVQEKNKVFKNYKELCQELGLKTKTGDSKTKQIENLQRFGRIEKIEGSQQYIIKEIYSTIKPKPIRKDSVFIKFIELILMYRLSMEEGNSKSYSKTQLYKELGMINENYLYKNREEVIGKIISNELVISNSRSKEEKEEDTIDFINRVSNKLNGILNGAIKSLENRCLIRCQQITKIIDKNGDSWEASEDEIERILNHQQMVLKEMGENKIPYYRIREFYDKFNQRINIEENWRATYKEYKIIWSREYLPERIPEVEKELTHEILKNKIEINNNLINSLHKQAERLREKNIEIVEEQVKKIEDGKLRIAEYNKGFLIESGNRTGVGTVINDKAIKREELYSDDYIEIQDKLAEIFIRIKNDKINNEDVFDKHEEEDRTIEYLLSE